MANLNVVVPAVEVEVDGVKYRKVDRKAQAGDLVRELTDDIGTTVGAFYEVIERCGRACFYDDDEDLRTPTLSAPRFEVYEKLTPVAPEYREVKRDAKVGDRIRIVNSCDIRWNNGEEFVVDTVIGDSALVKHPEGAYDGRAHVLRSEYVVLESVEQAEAPAQQSGCLRVGDYAKVIDADGDMRAKIGDIITVEWSDGSLIGGTTFDGRSIGMFARRFVRATESEVKRAWEIGPFADGGYAVVKPDADGYLSGFESGSYVEVRPTKVPGRYALEIKSPRMSGYNDGFCNADALRKVTKEEYEEATKPKPVFNVGDTVILSVPEGKRARFGWGAVKNGDIGEVISVKPDRVAVKFPEHSSWYADPSELMLLTTEEAKWAKIGRKVGEYKNGDIVEVTGSDSGHTIGTIGVIEYDLGAPRVRANGRLRSHLGQMRLIVPVEQRFDLQKEAA